MVARLARPGPGRWRAGFTLMEMLIALTLVSLILVLLYGGLRLGARGWDSLDRHQNQTNDLRFARGILQRMLLQARSVNRLIEQRLLPVFVGNRQQLEFVTPLSEYAGVGGLYLVRLYLDRTRETGSLKMQRWLLHPDIVQGGRDIPEWQPLANPGRPQDDGEPGVGLYGVNLLAREIEDLEFSYFGREVDAERSDMASWQQEWRQRTSLPTLVRVRVRRGGDWWPDLIVPLAQGAGQ